MKKFFTIFTAFLLILVLALGAACSPRGQGGGTGNGGDGDGGGSSGSDKDPIPVSVTISGRSEVKSGQKITLVAMVSGDTDDRSVTWSVTEGEDIVSVSRNGVVTAKEVTETDRAKIRATSNADNTKYAEVTVTVLAKSNLTQAMLDALHDADHTHGLEIDTVLDLELWSFGTPSTLGLSDSFNMSTMMDGEYWYANYEDTATHDEEALYIKEVDGYVNEVSLSLMNEEEYFPMTDRRGKQVPWENGGYYDNFAEVSLSVDDFTFNEDSYLWEYTGADKDFVARVIASANPYDYSPKSLSLLIAGNSVLGFISDSEPDYSVQAGYEAHFRLTSTLNFGTEEDPVTVPKVAKFEHDAEIHDKLQRAIDNMRSHTSYTLTFENYETMYFTTEIEETYVETITPDLLHFTEEVNGQKLEYGYKNMGNGLVNAFYSANTPSGYEATQAYNATDLKSFTPGFNFSAEIFFHAQPDTEPGRTNYFVDLTMMRVANEFYCGMDVDDELFGLYATYLYTGSGYMLPYVTVDDATEEIVGAGFYYDMASINTGSVSIEYDFGEVKPKDIDFTARQMPTSWEGFPCHIAESDEEDRRPALDYFEEHLGTQDVPFFGEALGDTYGFVTSQLYRPISWGAINPNMQVLAVSIYYNVPLDADYTVTSSMDAVKAMLLEDGYTLVDGADYEFTNGVLGIAVADVDQDFMVYVWKEQPALAG